MPNDLDLSEAVRYHYDQFPPTLEQLETGKLIKPLSAAAAALARYDQMLKTMHNNELLLAPLRSQEAVVSSRMEGTVSTLDEVLRFEADYGGDEGKYDIRYRSEAVEVFLYQRALGRAQGAIQEGAAVSEHLMRSAHRILLGFGRGADASPGEYKKEQNYVIDRRSGKVLFVPTNEVKLKEGMEKLLLFIGEKTMEPLIKTALAHVEFEALHPFRDGNGRIGRMLITLMLRNEGIISAPHFYVSAFFEAHRDQYLESMRNVSKSNMWTDWCVFFLNGLEKQAEENLKTAQDIQGFYEDMRIVFREKLSSKWHIAALDFLFETPVFRNNMFTTKSGIPRQTAARFTRVLVGEGLLRVIEPPAGRRPGLYAFEPLLKLVRD
jgi:Fic family protein